MRTHDEAADCSRSFTKPRRREAASHAFTLVELVAVLTILALMAAASIPSFRGYKDEAIAREPVAELARMAKLARLHAIKEKRPYQIAFTSKGFTATRYLSPYLQAVDLQKFVDQVQQDADNAESMKRDDIVHEDGSPVGSSAAPNADRGAMPPAPPFKEWTETYSLPEGTTCTVKFWFESSATDIGGDVVKLWVFQPNGLSPPVTVHLERPSATFEATFNALTADISKEVSELK